MLANWVWQGCAVALAATAILRASRRVSATTRYHLWWVTLAVVLVLPALSSQLPASSGQLPAPSFQLPASGYRQALTALSGDSAPRDFAGSWKPEAGSFVATSSKPRASTPPPVDSLAAGDGVVRLGGGFPLADAWGSCFAAACQAHRAPISCRTRGPARDLALASRKRPPRGARRVGQRAGGRGTGLDVPIDRRGAECARRAGRSGARSDRRPRMGPRAASRRPCAPRSASHRCARRPSSGDLVDRPPAQSRARDRVRRLGGECHGVCQGPGRLPDEARGAAGPARRSAAACRAAVFRIDDASRPAARPGPQHEDDADRRCNDACRTVTWRARTGRRERRARRDVASGHTGPHRSGRPFQRGRPVAGCRPRRAFFAAPGRYTRRFRVILGGCSTAGECSKKNCRTGHGGA